GADQRTGTDPDERQDGGVHADLGACADEGPRHDGRGARVPGVEVVGDGHARSEEGVVPDLGELRDVTVAVHLRRVCDAAAVVDDGAAPDADIVADPALLPHHDVVPGL